MELIVRNLDGLKQCKEFCDKHHIKFDYETKDYIFFDEYSNVSVKGFKIIYNYEYEDLGYYDFRYHENYSKLSLKEIQKFKDLGITCAFCNKQMRRAKIYFIKNNNEILTLGKTCYKNIDLRTYYPNFGDCFDEKAHYHITNFKLSQLINYVENFKEMYVTSNIAYNITGDKTPKQKFIEYTENNSLNECSNEKLNYYLDKINNLEESEFNDSIKRIANDPLGVHIEASGKILSVLFSIKENNIKENAKSVNYSLNQITNIKCKLVFIKCYPSYLPFSGVTYKHYFTSDKGIIVWYTTSKKLFDSIDKEFLLSAKKFNIKDNQITVKRPSLHNIS